MKDVVEFVSDAVSANAARAVMGAGVAAAVEEAAEELAQMAAAVWTASPSRADPPQLQAARIMAASEPIIGCSTTQVFPSLQYRTGHASSDCSKICGGETTAVCWHYRLCAGHFSSQLKIGTDLLCHVHQRDAGLFQMTYICMRR